MASRTESSALDAMSWIRSRERECTGELRFLQIDFEDLQSVSKAVKQFLDQERRLDGLFNNAGVMLPPTGEGLETEQGHELQLGTNVLAPFFFTKLLSPVLTDTAKRCKSGEVRVVWVSSSAAELLSPHGGVRIDDLDYQKEAPNWASYAISKAGVVLISQEYAKQHKADGIISVVRRAFFLGFFAF